MTMDEINAEVAAYRCERRATASRAITTGGNDRQRVRLPLLGRLETDDVAKTTRTIYQALGV